MLVNEIGSSKKRQVKAVFLLLHMHMLYDSFLVMESALSLPGWHVVALTKTTHDAQENLVFEVPGQ